MSFAKFLSTPFYRTPLEIGQWFCFGLGVIFTFYFFLYIKCSCVLLFVVFFIEKGNKKLLKKKKKRERHRHRCLPVHVVKCLRTNILKNICGQLLLSEIYSFPFKRFTNLFWSFLISQCHLCYSHCHLSYSLR